METLWLLTAITRSAVAAYIIVSVLAHTLEAGWWTVAAFDAACALIQAIGLQKDWLPRAA
jgi:hypothetical protein